MKQTLIGMFEDSGISISETQAQQLIRYEEMLTETNRSI